VLGQTATALRHAEEARQLLDAHPDEIHIAGPYLIMAKGYALLFAGHFSAARTLVEHGVQDAVGVGDQGLIAAWSGLAGVIAQTRGDLAAAVSALREAVAIEERQDPTDNLRLHLTVLAGALAMSGSVGEAQEALYRADELTTPVRRLFAPQVETNRAWVAAAAGELGRAAELAVGAAAMARESELPGLEVMLLHDAARHGSAARVRQRLADLSSIVDGELAAACAGSAAALEAEDGPALARAAAVFARLDAPLLAAEAMVAASRAYRKAGETRQANAVTERAGEFAARCPSARTSGLVMNTATVALTPREREIALLAARAMSSPEIAARLGLSVRTVNNHLARVYDKLGTPGRAELAKLFGIQQLRD
jgi:ATP/maltotriose-dependent transcriptional regulator MalT